MICRHSYTYINLVQFTDFFHFILFICVPVFRSIVRVVIVWLLLLSTASPTYFSFYIFPAAGRIAVDTRGRAHAKQN